MATGRWPGLVLLATLAASGAAADGGYRRGDATCSTSVTAVDLVATIRAAAGGGTCGNDDCDRDGAVGAADLACAVGCLFDACPVPEHAARVTAVVPASAPEVVPASAVRIALANPGPAEASRSVAVGGFEAEVVDAGTGELLVALPADLPVGPAELVVTVGDLAGPPVVVDVSPPVPRGPPDTLDGTLDLVDEALAKLLALDVEAAFPDDAASVRAALAQSRGELATQRASLAADPALTDADRLALDAAVDASGSPELLRAAIAEIDAVAGVAAAEGGPAAPTQPYLAFQNGARTIKIAGTVVRTVATGLGIPIAIAIGTGLAINAGAVAVASDPLTPLIFSAAYTDANGTRRVYPTGGGFITLTGAHFDASLTSLEIQTSGGAVTLGRNPMNGADGSITYQLPDAVGICGAATFVLSHAAGRYRSNPVTTRIQPELLGLDLSTGRPLESVTGTSRGASDCFAADVVFRGVTTATGPVGFNGVRNTFLRVPEVLPGTYAVGLTVKGVRSLEAEDALFNVANPLTGLELRCPREIDAPGATGAPPATCSVRELPPSAFRPKPSTFVWTSTRPGRVSVPATTSDPEAALVAHAVGGAGIKVALESAAGPRVVLATSAEVEVRVVDRLPPTVAISSTATSPVQPGAAIAVTVTAADNDRLGPLQLAAGGDAVANGATQESLECLGKKSCSASFTVLLRERDFTQTTVTVQATAFDAAALSRTSSQLTFSIARDTSCPSVAIQEPASGADVDAGSTVTVVAVARDDGPSDSGVRRFVYSATGAALAAPVAQELPLPMAQKAPTLRFNFTVKGAAELADVEDKTIAISVEAFDDAMPPNSCGPQTLSVGILGVLDRCQGGITTDNPAGFIGEPFTVTVALTGEGAGEITRVTSINPGGQFDLQPRGGGVYTVTLFYQGTGAFTLRFIAVDGNGDERCAGSIALESLGPRPEGGAAAAQGAAVPAGARR